MKSLVRALSLVLAVAMVATTEVGAAQGPTIKGDPQAWAEVKAALGRLATLKTYRIKGMIRTGDTQAWEMVNPDRVHYTRTLGGKTIDTIRVGKEMLSIGPIGGKVNLKLYVGLANGLPKRQQGLNEKGTVNFTWDYYDFNAPLTIDLPSCA